MLADRMIMASSGVIDATITYIGDTTIDATQTAFTFSSHAIGTAASNRRVIVGVSTAGGTQTVSTLTVGGISATYAGRAQNGTHNYELWSAAVPTGTTADIVVTMTGNVTHCNVGVYDTKGAASSTTDVQTDLVLSGTDLSVSVNIPAGGIAAGGAYNNADRTHSWTNLIEAFDNTFTNHYETGAEDEFATEQTGLTITCTLSSSVGVTAPGLIVATWGPA